MKRIVCLWVIAAFLIGMVSVPVHAADGKSTSQSSATNAPLLMQQHIAERDTTSDDDMPSGELIITDAAVMRPLGIVSMAVGLAGAIITLPWAATSCSTDRVGKKLIEEPFRYTFERKVGDVDTDP